MLSINNFTEHLHQDKVTLWPWGIKTKHEHFQATENHTKYSLSELTWVTASSWPVCLIPFSSRPSLQVRFIEMPKYRIALTVRKPSIQTKFPLLWTFSRITQLTQVQIFSNTLSPRHATVPHDAFSLTAVRNKAISFNYTGVSGGLWLEGIDNRHS